MENYGQMRLVRPQLRSRCSFGYSENLDVSAVVAVSNRNLKPWKQPSDHETETKLGDRIGDEKQILSYLSMLQLSCGGLETTIWCVEHGEEATAQIYGGLRLFQ